MSAHIRKARITRAAALIKASSVFRMQDKHNVGIEKQKLEKIKHTHSRTHRVLHKHAALK